MFTGLIETLGTVKIIRKGNRSLNIGIIPDMKDFSVSKGGSVSVNGVCLSMESSSNNMLYFTAVQETIERTTLSRISSGERVNLERAIRADARFEGHVVLGHIDDIGHIVSDRRYGDSLHRTIHVPLDLRRFMAHKGSVAIDGISLTIAELGKETITVALIPYTISETNISTKQVKDFVNIECDIFTRYIHRQLWYSESPGSKKGRQELKKNNKMDILSLLERRGF